MHANRPRLCFVVESGTDVRLVDGLAQACDLEIIARRIEGGREISQPSEVRYECTVGPAGRLAFGRFVFSRLRRAGEERDVVLVQGYGVAALSANVAARMAGVPSVMLVCSPIEAYYACRRLDGSRSYRWTEALGLRVAAWLNAKVGGRYVALSPYLATVVKGHGTAAPVDVMPVYGVDTRVFAPADEDRASLRRRLGLPVQASLVFFSSRVAPEKDPDVLIDAVAGLRRGGRDVRILHLSGGYREFVARAAARGLADAVIARDALPPYARLAEWYQAADVCVQASRAEGLGFSVLEALACGVPVVAAGVGGLLDTIVEGKTGWRYAPGDAAALATALRDALDHPEEGARRARCGRDMVIATYERDAVFDKLVTLLRQLSATPPRPA